MKTLKLKQFALKQSMLHLSQNPSILSDAQLHSDYLSKKLDKSHDAFHLIDNNYHLNVVEPRLLKYLQESRVIKDSIVELPRFQVNIRVGFKGLSKGAYGQYVDPIDVIFTNRH